MSDKQNINFRLNIPLTERFKIHIRSSKFNYGELTEGFPIHFKSVFLEQHLVDIRGTPADHTSGQANTQM